MRSVKFDFTDEVVVVTGASSGIGRQIALAFGAAGAAVINADVKQGPKDHGEETPTHERIAEDGGVAEYVETDVSDPADLETVVESAREFGGVDVMVNNAGIFRPASVRDVSVDDARAMQGVNINGAIFGTKAAANDMINRGASGSIVNIASVSSEIAQPSMVAYNATKGAVKLATMCSALDLAEHDIRVNGVAPGSILTEIIEGQTRDDPDEDSTDIERTDIPLGREGEPEDVPGAVLFLASDAAEYVTGEILFVDGGRKIL